MSAPAARPPAVHAGAASTIELAPGVHAWVQPGGGWCVNNAGIVAGGASTLLVDTAATAARVARLDDAVRRAAGTAPGVVVNTHHHGDHVHGNGRFAPGARIVAHERAREEMAAVGLGLTALWPDVRWGEVEPVLPDVVFRDTLTLHVGDERVEVIHVGPAHTIGDAVVWLPGPRVLFAGDVVMSGTTPYCLMGSVDGTLDALARLRALRPRVVVPGHGPVGGPELIDADERHLRRVRELAHAAAAAGLGALEAAREAGPVDDRAEPERLVGNLHRALAECDGRGPRGRPLDVLASFREMVAFHGGLPDCHA